MTKQKNNIIIMTTTRKWQIIRRTVQWHSSFKSLIQAKSTWRRGRQWEEGTHKGGFKIKEQEVMKWNWKLFIKRAIWWRESQIALKFCLFMFLYCKRRCVRDTHLYECRFYRSFHDSIISFSISSSKFVKVIVNMSVSSLQIMYWCMVEPIMLTV